VDAGRIKETLVLLDTRLFSFINIRLHNDFVAALASMTADDLFLAALVFAGIFIFAGRIWRKKKAVIAFTLWSIIAVNIISGFLKHLFKRPRPYLTVDGAMLLVKMHKNGYAFPSTHTAMAAVICAMFWNEFKAARPYLAAFVVLVGFFCVYTGGHYPSDVIAGFALGTAVAAAAGYLKNIYLKGKKETD
jgi:undecaprenyl-diphosphatase